MKTEEIFDMLNGIDEKLISGAGEELENYRHSEGKTYSVDEKSGFSWKRASAAIVCAAAIMLGAFIIVNNTNRTVIPVDDQSYDFSSSADPGNSSSTESSGSTSSNESSGSTSSSESSGGTSSGESSGNSSSSESSDSTSSNESSSSSIPSESSGDSSGDIPQTLPVQGYYDKIFEEIAEEPPTLWGPPPTFDEVIDEADDPKYGRLDSFYLVEAVETMIKSESGELIGFDDWFYGKYGVKYDEVRDKPEAQGADIFGNSVIYRVKVIEDLITGEKCGYDIYTDVYMNGPISQSPGDPPYAPGERFTLLLRNKAENSEIRDTAEENIFRLDVKEIDGVQVAFARRKCCGMSYFIAMNFEGSEKISETIVTSTTDNPVTYNTKIKLSDFCGFLRKEWQNRGVGSGEYTGYEKYIQQIAEEYKTAGINLSDEQIKKLNDLYVSQKVNPGWERLPYQEGIITGEVDPNTPKLDLETAKKIISEHTDFNEIIDEFKKVQQPDFIGGSGHIVILYRIDDLGSEIAISPIEKQIQYLKVDPDGTEQTETLFG